MSETENNTQEQTEAPKKKSSLFNTSPAGIIGSAIGGILLTTIIFNQINNDKDAELKKNRDSKITKQQILDDMIASKTPVVDITRDSTRIGNDQYLRQDKARVGIVLYTDELEKLGFKAPIKLPPAAIKAVKPQ